MSGPIEQNSSSGGTPIVPDDAPDFDPSELPEDNVSGFNPDQNAGDDDEDDDDDNEEDDDEDEDDEEEDFLAGLPPAIRSRVEELKKLNEKRDEYMEEYLRERAELEKKYSALCQPLYDTRRDIINGVDSKMEEPHATATNDNETDKSPENGEIEGEADIVGIPEFWTVAMCNIETIEELITERDTECLKYLEDITCEDFSNGLGFTLKFYFKTNPYFTNSVLTKTYDVPNLLLMDDEPLLKNVTGCDIDWKDQDMCLTHRVVCKKQRNKKGMIRHVKKNERTESFFHFFSPPKLPDVEDIDEEEADAIEEAFDHDYDVAQQFRSHIIPKGVLWFTGEAMNEALNGTYDGEEDNLLNSKMQGVSVVDNETGNNNASEGNLFPPSTTGLEEPECKQS